MLSTPRYSRKLNDITAVSITMACVSASDSATAGLLQWQRETAKSRTNADSWFALLSPPLSRNRKMEEALA